MNKTLSALKLNAFPFALGVFLAVIILVGANALFGRFCLRESFLLVNPDLGCSSGSTVDKRSYAELRTRITDYVQAKTAAGEVSEVALYFRDLQNGPTLGINEHEKFAPASLLKLPLLLTYYAIEENHPGSLKTQIEYEGTTTQYVQEVSPRVTLTENTPYTLAEMLRHMVVYSDNNAYFVLRQYLQQISPKDDLLADTFVELGIVDPKTVLDETVTVKSYSSIFVQLYNATFFDTEAMSDKVLALMTATDFKDGLVAGVPESVPVAHKFGERVGFPNEGKELHDCGIVYYPHNPYLLCIMTRGNDIPKLEGVIADVSKMVYDEFNSRAK